MDFAFSLNTNETSDCVMFDELSGMFGCMIEDMIDKGEDAVTLTLTMG